MHDNTQPSEQRGKVLIVTHYPVVPANGGGCMRILTLARSLSALGYQVHLAFFDDVNGSSYDVALHVAEFGHGRVHRITSSGIALKAKARLRSLIGKAKRRACRTLRPKHQYYFHIDEVFPLGTKACFQALQKAEGFTTVVAEYVFYSKLLTFLPNSVKKIIDTHDIFADRHKRMEVEGKRYKYLSFTSDSEVAGFRRANLVIAIQSAEAEAIRARLDSARPLVQSVSHIVGIVPAPKRNTAACAGIFLGSMSRGNADALHYLIKDIWPLVRKQIPDFQIIVAGSVGNDLRPQNGLIIMGEIEDIETAFSQGVMLLNPTRIGTGVAIKVLESFGRAFPVISTQVGARGHEGRPTPGMLVVPDHDPAAFAEAIVHLVQQPEIAKQLGREGYKTAVLWNAEQLAALSAAVAPNP